MCKENHEYTGRKNEPLCSDNEDNYDEHDWGPYGKKHTFYYMKKPIRHTSRTCHYCNLCEYVEWKASRGEEMPGSPEVSYESDEDRERQAMDDYEVPYEKVEMDTGKPRSWGEW